MGIMLVRNSPLSDNRISWNEIEDKPQVFPPMVALDEFKRNFTLGNNANTSNPLKPGAIEIPTDTAYGGVFDYHTGVLIGCGDMFTWGGAKLKIYVSSNWQTYNTSPCLTVGNDLLTTSGKVQALSFNALSIPNSPYGLSSGDFYRDSNGFVKIIP